MSNNQSSTAGGMSYSAVIALICKALADSTDSDEQLPFVEEARRVLDVLAAEGYAVVNLPEPMPEHRFASTIPAPTWRHAPRSHASPLRLQVQSAGDGYEVGAIEGNFTAEEAIARGAAWVAAGVEALRLQGGDPR